MQNKNIAIHYSSKTVEWETPHDLFDRLNSIFRFSLDVCATPENAKCKKFFTKEDNGLEQAWFNDICWMNPPYGREIGYWTTKAKNSGTVVVGLLPARVDTKWWHRDCQDQVYWFIRGRLKFGGMKDNAPFPNAIVIWGLKSTEKK